MWAAFGYADDLLLLSPSIHESFASEYGVTFNAKKPECICFCKNACPLQRQAKVNGQRIKWKDKFRYLGNILTKDMCDDADIGAKRGKFIGSVNRLNVQFRVLFLIKSGSVCCRRIVLLGIWVSDMAPQYKSRQRDEY